VYLRKAVEMSFLAMVNAVLNTIV